MGLDIYHIRAVKDKPSSVNPSESNSVLASEYTGFDVPISYFSAYLQLVDYPATVHTVIIPRSKKLVERTREWFKDESYQIVYHKHLEALNEAIRAIEKGLGYNKLQKHTVETSDWQCIDYYIFEQREGFYTEDLGYQRKGMNGAFSSRFYRPDIWHFTGRDNFDFALACVDHYWQEDTPEIVAIRKYDFRRNFIDNYKPGSSFMLTSY